MFPKRKGVWRHLLLLPSSMISIWSEVILGAGICYKFGINNTWKSYESPFYYKFSRVKQACICHQPCKINYFEGALISQICFRVQLLPTKLFLGVRKGEFTIIIDPCCCLIWRLVFSFWLLFQKGFAAFLIKKCCTLLNNLCRLFFEIFYQYLEFVGISISELQHWSWCFQD